MCVWVGLSRRITFYPSWTLRPSPPLPRHIWNPLSGCCKRAHRMVGMPRSSIKPPARGEASPANERQIKKAGILFVRKFFFLRKLSFMCINSVAKTALQQILHFEKLTYLHASKIQQNAKKYFIFRQEFVSKAKPFLYSFYSF